MTPAVCWTSLNSGSVVWCAVGVLLLFVAGFVVLFAAFLLSVVFVL